MIEEIRKGVQTLTQTAVKSEQPVTAQTGNRPQIIIQNQVLDDIVRELILDFFDMQKLTAPIANSLNMQQLQVSAYDFFLEPAVILDAMLTHTWQKYSLAPYTFAIDGNGNINLGGVAHQNVNLLYPALPTPNLLGHLFYVRINDTDLGESRFRYLHPVTGVTMDWDLTGQQGVAYVWNHSQDQRANQSYDAVSAPPSINASFVQSLSAITDSFYLNPFNQEGPRLSGLNAIVTAYPITGRDAIYNIMMAAIFGDAAGEIGSFIVETYASQLKLIENR